jgi:hypothetical protein
MAHDVFISYAPEDRLMAHAVCHALEETGIRCWLYDREYYHGMNYTVLDAIRESRIVVVVFSGHCNASDLVRLEVQEADSKGLIIIPFRVEDVNPIGDLEHYLSRWRWLDAVIPPLENPLRELCDAVKKNLTSGNLGRQGNGKTWESYNMNTTNDVSAPTPLMVTCPECGNASDSIKCYRMGTLVFLLLGYWARWKNEYGCPNCIRKKLFEFTAINLLTANLIWPLAILPWGIIRLIRSFTRGHSQAVLKIIADGSPHNS